MNGRNERRKGMSKLCHKKVKRSYNKRNIMSERFFSLAFCVFRRGYFAFARLASSSFSSISVCFFLSFLTHFACSIDSSSMIDFYFMLLATKWKGNEIKLNVQNVIETRRWFQFVGLVSDAFPHRSKAIKPLRSIKRLSFCRRVISEMFIVIQHSTVQKINMNLSMQKTAPQRKKGNLFSF